jgi:hypothetical protein
MNTPLGNAESAFAPAPRNAAGYQHQTHAGALFDPNEVARSWRTIVEPGSVHECRILGGKLGNGWKIGTVSGYFDNVTPLIAALRLVTAGNFYLTLNPVAPDLIARCANRLRFADRAGTTSDLHIARRRWLVVDCDPTRPAGISATTAEKNEAFEMAQAVRADLSAQGWPDPVLADSGNGCHLVYRVDLPADDGGLAARVLKALDARFSTGRCKLDTTLGNAARIIKLYGTIAAKGDNMPTRPHRLSRIVQAPDALEPVSRDLLAAVAVTAQTTKNSATGQPVRNGTAPRQAFDLDGFLHRHGIATQGERVKAGERIIVLEECPFDPSHGDHGEVTLHVQPGGRLGFKCHHSSCADRHWQDFRQRFEPDRQRHSSAPPTVATPATAPSLDGVVILPGHGVTITQAANELFPRVAKGGDVFTRGGAIVTTRVENREIILDVVKPAAARSLLERFATFAAWRSGRDGKPVLKPTVIAEDMARALLESQSARDHLPRITGLINCPIMFGLGDVAGPGYHAASGLLVTGGAMPPRVDLAEAVATLAGLLGEFEFQTEGDRARAIAMLVTPALKLGGHLRGNIPADAAEADKSQSGKTYRQKITAALYNERPSIVTARTGGVGSVDETFNQALIGGRPFIQLDNFRGRYESAHLEAFLTAERSFPCRVPHCREIVVDPSRFFVLLTSNGIETTRDFANRSCVVRIKKREGVSFKQYPEGDLLAHVRANQSYFLGCVFAVIGAWIAQGRQSTNETRHDFREWGGILDWIVQEIFGAAPLMDGHRAAQERVSNPALTFLRRLALAVRDDNLLGQPLTASRLYELAEDASVDVPGLREPNADHGKRQVGIVLGRVFKAGDLVEIDGFSVTKSETQTRRDNGGDYLAKTYTFRTTAEAAQDSKCIEKQYQFSSGTRSSAACAANDLLPPPEVIAQWQREAKNATMAAREPTPPSPRINFDDDPASPENNTPTGKE